MEGREAPTQPSAAVAPQDTQEQGCPCGFSSS